MRRKEQDSFIRRENLCSKGHVDDRFTFWCSKGHCAAAMLGTKGKAGGGRGVGGAYGDVNKSDPLPVSLLLQTDSTSIFARLSLIFLPLPSKMTALLVSLKSNCWHLR